MDETPYSEGAAPESPYFALQADIGITEHMGGLGATEELLEACNVSGNDSILDVGCGTGITPCYIAEKYGCDVVGLDISERMVDWSRKRVRENGLDDKINLIVGDAQNLPFEHERFDIVIGESVTAFVEDKQQAVDEYARVAVKDGYVGINESTWQREPPSELADYMAKTTGGEFLTQGEWTGLLEGAGLQDVEGRTHTVRSIGQFADELRRHGLKEMSRAWLRFFSYMVTDAEFRAYAFDLWPSSRAVMSVFEYQGYGIYVGRK